MPGYTQRDRMRILYWPLTRSVYQIHYPIIRTSCQMEQRIIRRWRVLRRKKSKCWRCMIRRSRWFHGRSEPINSSRCLIIIFCSFWKLSEINSLLLISWEIQGLRMNQIQAPCKITGKKSCAQKPMSVEWMGCIRPPEWIGKRQTCAEVQPRSQDFK